MKKYFLLFVLALTTSTIFCQTLFTYGNTAVSKDEFLKAYNKNKTAVEDKKKALREYLDLYIKFKLKVKAARDMHLDTLATISSDLKNFRQQIEEGYLNDEKELDHLVQEAVVRSRKDIHLLHFFIPVPNNLPADTLKRYKAIQELYEEMKKGKTNYEDILAEIKEEIAPVQGSDIGYVTVFSLPYEFENIVYNLKPGQFNKPYRTKKGWHIFRNEDERKAAGKWKAAQILLGIPEDATYQDQQKVSVQADSIYKALQAGADFAQMANTFSNDKITYMNGGIMPEFGTGKYAPEFESKVFALQKDNDFTKPFQTKYGFHIVKRLSVSPLIADNKDLNYLSELKLQVQQDTRMGTANEKFVAEVMKKLGYKKNNAVNEKSLLRMTELQLDSNRKISTPALNEKTILYSFGTGNVKVSDWLLFVKEYKNSSNLYKGESYKELLDKYVTLTALENYRKKLEYFNADFKYQIQEFKDGNLLFEVMERNVWAMASADSSGLKNYYNTHKEKYTWNASADAILFSCSNEKAANDAVEKLNKDVSWKQVAEDNATQMQTDSGRYELSQIPVKDRTNFIIGLVTAPVVNAADGTASFAKIIRLYPASQQRSFDEARGLVINDYQNALEDKWIEQLKKKYPVKVNENVFSSMAAN